MASLIQPQRRHQPDDLTQALRVDPNHYFNFPQAIGR